MRGYRYWLLMVMVLVFFEAKTQNATVSIQGKVLLKADKEPAIGAQVFLEHTTYQAVSTMDGSFELQIPAKGKYTLVVQYLGYSTKTMLLDASKLKSSYTFLLEEQSTTLKGVVIKEKGEPTSGLTKLKSVEGFGIYEAKKSEVIVLDDMVADKAANNARQVFAKIVGLNIWESDCAGLQIGVGGRGLSPNRTANFNTRQNGYDIAADALGYPETYYSPALQAVEKVEIVRGAASLQYGPQFGGLVNFKMKEGPEDKKIELEVQQTGNSLGYYNSFVSAGGTVGKVNYYAYNRTATGNCWRCNTDFTSTTSYGNINWSVNEKLKIKLAYTNMAYRAKQAGGLTDNQFEENPKQSNRARNWFEVDWNLAALELNWKIAKGTKLSIRNFGLIANRAALGNLSKPNRPDQEGQKRSLIDGEFTNFGSEARLLKHYKTNGRPSVLLIGGRFYKGLTVQQQGAASNGSGPDFNFTQPDSLYSDYRHPGINYSLFIENMFSLGDKWSLTPGVRMEYIQSESNGYYVNQSQDQAGNIIFYEKQQEEKKYERTIWLAGIGASFRPSDNMEAYANYSMNYRPVRFSDLRIVNNSLQIDENMSDETGFSADLGVRGQWNSWLRYDATLFLIQYNNKIGTIQKVDLENYRTYQFRTNIADSKHLGVESFFEVDLQSILWPGAKSKLKWFSNVTVLQAKYQSKEDQTIDGNSVENVPSTIIRQGVTFGFKKLSSTLQYNFTGNQFSDASNATSTPDGVFGEIPAYYTLDLILRYQWKKMHLTTGVNNITNNAYFTRRAEGYPGPGIIPSDGINLHFTLGIKL